MVKVILDENDHALPDQFNILVIGETLHLQSHLNISHVKNFTDESLLGNTLFTAIIINTRDKQESEKISINLRASSPTALIPLFTTTPTPFTDVITDGQIPDNLTLWLSTYSARKSQLKLIPENLDEKIICYLWLHESRSLRPKKHNSQAGIYQYPLIDLWDDSPSKDIWLLALERDDILSTEKLVDRIRQCNNCHSAALNYIETCPSCSSIDIKQESAIHCFTCGHVESQSVFMRQGKLSCPNCLTTLRHIGVDYDRPLENNRCNDCDTAFVDGKVKANCFSCGTSNELDALQQKFYYAYGLHDNGKIRAKTGELRQLLPSSIGETISREHFGWMVEWCNRIAVRHQQSHVLLVLSFTNLSDLLLSQSEVKVMEHLDAFIQRLKGLLRETDVCCQFQPHCLFFLLPNTPQSTMAILNDKLNTLVDTQSDNSLELSVSIDALPNDDLNEDVMLWLNQLYEKTINA